LNSKDAQLIESREFNSVDISRWFGVPTTKLGINKGVMTINEIRNDLDLGKIEHGDETLLQVNMTTLDNLINNVDKNNDNNNNDIQQQL
jgi:phage portal protein BeeE